MGRTTVEAGGVQAGRIEAARFGAARFGAVRVVGRRSQGLHWGAYALTVISCAGPSSQQGTSIEAAAVAEATADGSEGATGESQAGEPQTDVSAADGADDASTARKRQCAPLDHAGRVFRSAWYGADDESALQEHAHAVVAAVSSFAAEFDEAMPCPVEVADVTFSGIGPDKARARLVFEPEVAFEAMIRFAHRDGGWQVRGFVDIEVAQNYAALVRWLSSTPTVDVVSSIDEGRFRRIRVGEASGSTTCIVMPGDDEASVGPWCWKDHRPIELLWSLPHPSTKRPSVSRREEDTDEEQDEDDRLEEPPRIRLAVGPFEQRVEVWDYDFKSMRRRRVGEIPLRSRQVRLGPFWLGQPQQLYRWLRKAPTGGRGAEEPIELVTAPPWLAVLSKLSVTPVHSSSGIAGVTASQEQDEDRRTLLCGRRPKGWSCGFLPRPFEEADGREEVNQHVARIEWLGADKLAAEYSMRVDGGSGDGSGATGSAELHLFEVDGRRLLPATWVALGGMEWTTLNYCGWESPCYFRAVKRAFHRWRVGGESCLTFERIVGEALTADYGFARVRRAGGRTQSLRRLSEHDARELIEGALPGLAQSPAIAFDQNLQGSWQWVGPALQRAPACDAQTAD